MKPLERLASEQFVASVGAVTSPQALRRYFHRCDDVKSVRTALEKGQISEATIRWFVDGLMRHFVRGFQFPFEIALAALAVALETRQTKFADDYLLDLARLRDFSEMHVAPRVAGLCMTERGKATKFKKKLLNQGSRLEPYWRAMIPQGTATASTNSLKRFKV